MTATQRAFPTPLTSLVGRDEEAAALAGLLRSGPARLVTLTGPGGVGKTRLSLAAAELVAADFDRRWFVPLASLEEAGLVAQAIAQALDIPEPGGQRIIEQLVEALSDGRQLLVLDNFEQVIDAALIVPRLLAGAPELRIIVTSRERLRVSGEQEFPVRPLELPAGNGRRADDPAALATVPAVRLFLERAQATRPDFGIDRANAEAVAEICTRLDGLPLALELAAARVRLLPPQALLARLDDRLALLVGGPRDLDPRQQTLRAAIGWSYELLDEPERAALRCLAVPVGSFTVEAATALISAGSDPDPLATLGLLESLLDKSLIRELPDAGGEARFAMLESIRAYGLEQAVAGGEVGALHAAHLGFLAGYVRERCAALTGERQREALQALDLEHDNIRASLEWAIGQGRTADALELAEPLWRYWTTRGLASEGFGWLMSLLGLPGLDDVPANTRARLHDGIGAIAYLMGDRRMAEEHHRAAFELQDSTVDPLERIRVLNHLAMAVQDQGNRAEAAELLEQALGQARLTGDARLIGLSLYNLGYLASERYDYARALELVGESMGHFEAIGDDLSVADNLNTLGYLHYVLGDLEAAREHCARSVAAFEALGDRYGIAEASGDLGLALEALGEAGAARQAYARSIELAQETGNSRRAVEAMLGLGRVEWLAGEHDRARELFENALDASRRLDHGVGLVTALLHCAAASLAAADLELAAGHLREALELSRQLDHLPGILLGLCGYAALSAAHGSGNDARGYLQSAGDLQRQRQFRLLPFEQRWRVFFQTLAEQVAAPASVQPEPRSTRPFAPEPASAGANREQAAARFGITARELEVVTLLVEGLSNQEIADQLFITRRTATTHVANIMNKLGLSSRTAVAALAVREGFA